jgi:hypothetical protein
MRRRDVSGRRALAAVSSVACAPSRAVRTPGLGGRTPGGKGGRVMRVTTLAGAGPGSFREAVSAKGPRTIVFDVAGIIDLGRHSIKITEPFLTVSGETAPSPGVTFIKGGVGIETHDVIIRHIRVRAGRDGAPSRSGWEVDGITCWKAPTSSSTTARSAGPPTRTCRPRDRASTGGEDVKAWREGTSHRITFSNNIVAEGLSNASHVKGEHSKGSLIHDNATEVLIVGNLYAHNRERNQLFKGGSTPCRSTTSSTTPARGPCTTRSTPRSG